MSDPKTPTIDLASNVTDFFGSAVSVSVAAAFALTVAFAGSVAFALAFALACACGLPAAASRQFLARLYRIAPQSLGVLAQSDAWQRESERDTPYAAAGKTGEPRPLDARIDAQLAGAAIAVEQATGRPLRSSAVAAAWDEADGASPYDRFRSPGMEERNSRP